MTSNDIKLESSNDHGVSDQGVIPVRYIDDKGEEEDPILIMKISKKLIIIQHKIMPSRSKVNISKIYLEDLSISLLSNNINLY